MWNTALTFRRMARNEGVEIPSGQGTTTAITVLHVKRHFPHSEKISTLCFRRKSDAERGCFCLCKSFWLPFLALVEPWWHQPSDCVEVNWVLTAQICLSLVVLLWYQNLVLQILDSFAFVVSSYWNFIRLVAAHFYFASQRIRDSTQNLQELTYLSILYV